MRIITSIAAAFLLIACSTNTRQAPAVDLPLDSLASRYVRDSVALDLDIPASYQFISMRVDTINGAKSDEEKTEWILNELKGSEEEKHRVLTDTTGDSLSNAQYINSLEEGLVTERKMLDSIKQHPSPPHAIHHLNITLKYRALTKSGSMINETIDLYYYPNNKSFMLADDYD